MDGSLPRTPYEHFERRIGQMDLERASWVAHWKELTKNFSPRKGRFFTSDRNRGSMRNELLNNTPLFARRVLRSGLMTGITSPARPWFRLGPPDPEMEDFGPVREWLESAERLMYRIYAASNLYQQLPNVYDEAGVVGTAAMIQEEDFDTIARFSTFTVGEYYLDIDGKLRVDTFAREYEMTVYQLVSEFGLDNISIRARRAWDTGGYNVPVTVCHVIEPVAIRRFDQKEFRLDEQFKWRSAHYEKGTDESEKKMLRVRGYREFPIMAPRWDPRAGDTYGYSAGMDALGDSKALQVQEREKGKAIAKMVSPPTKAPSSLKNRSISLLPGANTFVDDPNGVFSPIYQVNPQVHHLAEDIRRTEERINRAFYVDLFLMISQQDDVRTATEIAARQEEKLLQLGPVLESLHNELLDPLIDRTFSIIMRESERGWRGDGPELLPPPPQELSDAELRVEYISVLAQAQKLVNTGAIERWVGFAGQLASIKPAALRRVNEDAIVKQMGEDLGVPNASIHDDEAVQQMAEAEAAAAQQQQDQAVMGGMVDAASQLADINTSGGNVISDLLGTGGGQAV